MRSSNIVDGRVGEARIDEARLLALEARLGGLGAVIDEALGQEDRLGVLAELRPEDAAMDQRGRRPEFFLLVVRFAIVIDAPNKKPGRAAGSGAFPSDLLATCLTWLQAGRLK